MRNTISRVRRWLDRRRESRERTGIAPYQWALMQNNMEYRERHYWQINRGRG